MTKPPLDLHVELVDANNVHRRLDSNLQAGDRPQNLSFRTKRGDGFGDAGFTLSRRIDLDYADLGLFDGVNLIGYDGSVAYEGRLGSSPRSLGDGHSIMVQAGGWMTHAKDRKFRAIYVDRDLSGWHPPSHQRIVNLLAGSPTFKVVNTGQVVPDTGNPALVMSIERLVNNASSRTLAEAWWGDGMFEIGAVYYDVITRDQGNSALAAPWTVKVFASSDDVGTSMYTGGSELRAGVAEYITPTAGKYYLIFEQDDVETVTADGQWNALLRDFAVYGTHGLTRRGTANPGGFYASDVIRDIAARYCPKLNTAGVVDTDHVIEHIVFRERTTPYDAFARLNDPHLYDLAVWENRTLHFKPFDLTDYKWQVKTTDQNVSVDLQGDSTEDLANFAVVQFTDVQTGQAAEIGPDQYPELRDDNVENPANRHGEDKELTVPLSYPVTEATAAQIGRAALAEHNQPKAAGTINVRGHIRDRAGNWQPVWKVRAGDTIAIVDYPNDRPRLVVETDYSHRDHQLKVAVDSSFKSLEAVSDRILTALEARGLR